MEISSLLIFMGFAILAGALSTFFGIGGGIILVPGLYLLFPKSTPVEVVAISHFAIFLNGSLNIKRFLKNNLKIPYELTFYLSLSLLAGTQIGRIVLQHINSNTAKVIFSLLLLIVGIKSLLSHNTNETNGLIKITLNRSLKIKISIQCLLGGIIAGMTGIGGGIIVIPILMMLSININLIPLISNSAVVASTFFATISNILIFNYKSTNPFQSLYGGNFHFGYLFPVISLYILLFTLTGSKIGMEINKRVPSNIKKYLFIFLLFAASLNMYLSTSK